MSKIIATASINQLSESNLSSDLENENARFLVSIDNQAQQISPTLMKQYFQAGIQSQSGGNAGTTVGLKDSIDIFSTNTYVKQKLITLNEIWEVSEETYVNMHGFAQFPSTASNGNNSLAVYIEIPGQDPLILCGVMTNSAFASVDRHIHVFPGVKIYARATYNGSLLDDASGKFYLSLYRQGEPFTNHGVQKIMSVPVNGFGSEWITFPNMYGAVRVSGRASINTPETNNYDNGLNIHLQCRDSDDGTPYNLDTIKIQAASTGYDVQFKRVLVKPNAQMRVVFAGKAVDKSQTAAYGSNTFKATFEAIDDIQQTQNISAYNQISFENPIGTVLNFNIAAYDGSKTDDFQSLSNANTAANNIIGVMNAEEASSNPTYVCFGSPNSLSAIQVENLAFPLMWMPAYRKNSSAAGAYTMAFTDNISKLKVSDATVPSFAKNLCGIKCCGSKLTAIDDYCFKGCSNIQLGEWPNSISSIGSRSTMHGCSILTRAYLPSCVTDFNNLDATFAHCSSLISVNLNDLTCCTHVTRKAFKNCVNLETIDLRHIKKIGENLSASADDPFIGCKKLKQIIFDYNNIVDSDFHIMKYAFQNINKNDFKIKILNCPDNLGDDGFKQAIQQKLNTVTAFKGQVGITLHGYTTADLSKFNYDNISGSTYSANMS